MSLDTQRLSAEEATVSQSLLSAAEALLPAEGPGTWRDGVVVRWREDLPDHVVGRARGRELGLDRRLLQALSRQEVGAERAAMAALLHEVAHVIDRAGEGRLSRDPRFLQLAGWRRRALLPGHTGNATTLRSPDLYELKEPGEFFAVNFEYYLTDPSYACRRPALARWYATTVGPSRIAAATCDSGFPFVQVDAQGGGVSLLQLDPARVYAVDHLLAEGNERLMSRWGHSMLRLVVCAPGRLTGPGCRQDVQHHLVLSFRAFVEDVQISSLRGLTGRYPSRLFVLPLAQVVEEYTRVELRALSSQPLALSAHEVAAVVERAAQLHWSHDGRYYFLTNNCAVEALQLLRGALPRLARSPVGAITPAGLARELARHDWLGPLPTSREQAIAQGYHFPSAAEYYRRLFDVVVGESPGVMSITTVEEWLAASPAQRLHRFGGSEQAAAAAWVLERAAQRRFELRVLEWVKRTAASGDRSPAVLAQWWEAAGAVASPGQWVADGYGIPDAVERKRVQDRVKQLDQRSRTAWEQLHAQFLQDLPEAMRQERQGIEHNLGVLSAHMKRGAPSAGSDLRARGWPLVAAQ